MLPIPDDLQNIWKIYDSSSYLKESENLRRVRLSVSLEDSFEKDKREDCDHSTERWLHQMRHENRTCATEKDRKVKISEVSESKVKSGKKIWQQQQKSR